jgi:acetyltransferase-like isoleucine patch superfamily enzyme
MNLFRLIARFLIGFIRPKRKVEYRIGNIKFHNSHIDTLFPALIEIGDNFISAPGSMILAHDASLYVHTGKYRVGPVTIGDNVFLGANAVVLPNVCIGDNVIIGAGAVVTKSVESGLVVAGNPAREICTVEEYIDKCELREVLVAAPDGFKKVFNNQRVTQEDICDFRTLVSEKMK